jgi:hypothetical protein
MGDTNQYMNIYHALYGKDYTKDAGPCVPVSLGSKGHAFMFRPARAFVQMGCLENKLII